MTRLPERAVAAFLDQARACDDLGSPFMGRLMRLVADRLDGGPVGARIASWPGELGPHAGSVPLRLAGALHALRLTGEARLAAVYPPREAGDDGLWGAIAAVLGDRSAEILSFMASPPQTNEVRRAAGLIAAAHWLAARTGLPIRLSELGASAGLNLMFDRFALQAGGVDRGAANPVLTLAPEWRGTPPPAAAFTIAERRGVDLSPIDPRDPEGELRLLAYLWADQPERIRLTRAAIGVAGAPVDRGDAVAWLAGRLAPVPGTLHLVFHTIAWQYFPPEVQARGEALLAEAGARAAGDAPLARLAMEGDGGTPGAGLSLTLWPGGGTWPLGRIDYHGRWVDWRAPAPV